MTNVGKIKLALIIAPSMFWIVIIATYLGQTKGLSTGEMFRLISLYYFFGMFLEYPTGVIGDYFSHKLSVILGHFLCALALVWLLYATGYIELVAFYFLYALGGAFLSGSDNALLYKHTNKFERELSDTNLFIGLVRFTELILAGFLAAKVSLEAPIMLSVISSIMAIFILLTVKTKKEDSKNKISFDDNFQSQDKLLKFGWKTFKGVLKNKTLLGAILLTALLVSCFLMIKWLLNPFFVFLGLDVRLWGIIGGTSWLLISFGSWLYPRLNKQFTSFRIIILVISGSLFLMGIHNIYLAVLGLGLLQITRGITGVKTPSLLNNLADDDKRASILSLSGVIRKIFSIILSFVIGYLLGITSFTGTLFILSFSIFIIGFTFLFGFKVSKY